MIIKYYVDSQGNYLGGFDSSPPSGAIEVPEAPLHASQKWSKNGWSGISLSKDEQISAIESNITSRWLRMAPLGDSYAILKLQEIEDQIEIIRNS